jgi:mono/diheme cytochrome c family protein
MCSKTHASRSIRNVVALFLPSLILLVSTGAGCSNGGAPASVSGLRVVTASGSPLAGQAGDALKLKVVQTDNDGKTADLPGGAKVSWTLPSTIAALAPEDDTDPSPLPAFGVEPTAVFIDNPNRADRNADLADALFLLDPGTAPGGPLQISATVTGVMTGDAGEPSASAAVASGPVGDPTRGSTLYGPLGANCAQCHGLTGHGSTEPPGSTTFAIAGHTYDFPAPGLNAEDGNVGSDPAWNAALLAVSCRSDVDNGGVTLRAPMPDWLVTPNPATGQPLTTQDFADIYAFLQTQTQ